MFSAVNTSPNIHVAYKCTWTPLPAVTHVLHKLSYIAMTNTDKTITHTVSVPKFYYSQLIVRITSQNAVQLLFSISHNFTW